MMYDPAHHHHCLRPDGCKAFSLAAVQTPAPPAALVLHNHHPCLLRATVPTNGSFQHQRARIQLPVKASDKTPSVREPRHLPTWVGFPRTLFWAHFVLLAPYKPLINFISPNTFMLKKVSCEDPLNLS